LIAPRPQQSATGSAGAPAFPLLLKIRTPTSTEVMSRPAQAAESVRSRGRRLIQVRCCPRAWAPPRKKRLCGMAITPQRLARLKDVCASRMAGLRIVLDGLGDPGNRAAVIRSSEALGCCRSAVHPPEFGIRAHVLKHTHDHALWRPYVTVLHVVSGCCTSTLCRVRR
jgi:hypothetical protein